MAKFKTYQTEYFYDSNIRTIVHSHSYEKPKYNLDDTIELTLFVNNAIKHIPSKIVKIVQEIKETDEDEYVFVWCL